MPICSRCGNEIEFRYIDGRCVPLHLYGGGGCGGSARSDVFDYPGYRRSKESCCFQTNCPECGDKVYFIRHNGGSVWIDPPLGPPWYKHPCMDNAYVPVKHVRSLVVSGFSLAKFRRHDGLILGIVKEAEASASRQCSLINIEAGKDKSIILLMKNNAGFLAGHLVLYDQRGKRVSWVEDESYVFRVIARLKPRPVRPQVLAFHIECPECADQVTADEISEHLKRQHWFPRSMVVDNPPDQTELSTINRYAARGTKTKARISERVCPNPSRWNEVFKLLTEYSRAHPCRPRDPPAPLILAGWAHGNDTEKMRRWKETVDWASANGCAGIVERVADQDFHQVGASSNQPVAPTGGPCYRPRDFEAKMRPSEDELASRFEYLSAHWANVAGPALSTVTRPLTFTGKKARRLLVEAEGTAVPPWGGWSHRSPNEAQRRTFTQFRSAVNQAIAPHEVDHIEFNARKD